MSLYSKNANNSSIRLQLHNQDQIQNQRPRFLRNTLFLGGKAGVSLPVPKCYIKKRHYFTKPPPLFQLKLVYSYVIEVADSKYQLRLHDKALVSGKFSFYHLLKYARGRPERRGHVHLGQNVLFIFFKIMKVRRVMRV